MIGIHCDGPGCDTWAKKPMALRSESGFLRVSWSGTRLDFCSWDCVLRFGATQEPISEVPLY